MGCTLGLIPLNSPIPSFRILSRTTDASHSTSSPTDSRISTVPQNEVRARAPCRVKVAPQAEATIAAALLRYAHEIRKPAVAVKAHDLHGSAQVARPGTTGTAFAAARSRVDIDTLPEPRLVDTCAQLANGTDDFFGRNARQGQIAVPDFDHFEVRAT